MMAVGWKGWSVLLYILILYTNSSSSANILALFPFSSRSHSNLFSAITFALAEKGHSFTVITSQPLDSTPPNYRQVDFSDLAEKILHDFSSTKEIGLLEILAKSRSMYEDVCRHTLFHPEVKKLLKPSNESEHFDMIITNSVFSECLYGFAYIYRAPLVLISPPGPVSTTYNTLGLVALPSCITNVVSGFTDHMTFPQRIVNTVQTYGLFIYYYKFILNSVFSIMKDAYGEDIPPFSEIEKSMSLILVNHHFALNGARPLAPNLIEVGGLHIRPPKDLPKELKGFMDGAGKDGIIYVSLGSILKSMNFPIEVRDAFIGAFSQLKQRVLWKYEGDSPLPGQTENVKLEKWLPQQDVLAHPNVKLFITHGGLLSMQEAASRGVPLIGIPFFGDQFTNLQRVTDLQIGLSLDSKNITKENILKAVHEMLDNP
ncbi:UDP-glycosyltransferase, partial [Ladona fulva]